MTCLAGGVKLSFCAREILRFSCRGSEEVMIGLVGTRKDVLSHKADLWFGVM